MTTHPADWTEADWPDAKPNSEFIPSAWPKWGDFRQLAQAAADHDKIGEGQK